MAVAYVGIFTNVGVTGYFARCYYRERQRDKERGGKGKKEGKRKAKKMERKIGFVQCFFFAFMRRISRRICPVCTVSRLHEGE